MGYAGQCYDAAVKVFRAVNECKDPKERSRLLVGPANVCVTRGYDSFMIGLKELRKKLQKTIDDCEDGYMDENTFTKTVKKDYEDNLDLQDVVKTARLFGTLAMTMMKTMKDAGQTVKKKYDWKR